MSGTFVNFRNEASPLARLVVYWYAARVRDAYRGKAQAAPEGKTKPRVVLRTLARFVARFVERDTLDVRSMVGGIRAHMKTHERSARSEASMDKALDELVLRSIITESVKYEEYRFTSSGFLSRVVLAHLNGGFDDTIARPLSPIWAYHI